MIHFPCKLDFTNPRSTMQTYLNPHRVLDFFLTKLKQVAHVTNKIQPSSSINIELEYNLFFPPSLVFKHNTHTATYLLKTSLRNRKGKFVLELKAWEACRKIGSRSGHLFLANLKPFP